MSINVQKLNEHLLSRSYIEGYSPSQADVHVFKTLGAAPSATEAPNVARWYKHIQTYDAEFGSLPGTSTAGEAFVGGAAAEPAKAAEEEEEEVDLFGSDDEAEEDEDTKAKKQAILDEYNKKKAAKPKAAAKSVVTLEVKPWDDTTDMDAMTEAVKSIEKPGLVWGAHKFVAVGFGIKKLQMTLVIEDELVSLDELQEEIEGLEDYVQSTDVAAMQKL